MLDGTTPHSGLRFDAITTQVLKTLIVEIDKYTLNSKWNFKGPRIVKISLTKRNKVGGLDLWFQNLLQKHSNRKNVVLA